MVDSGERTCGKRRIVQLGYDVNERYAGGFMARGADGWFRDEWSDTIFCGSKQCAEFIR